MLGNLNLTSKEEISRYISEKNIKILNLCHIPEDGRLKTLSFAAIDQKRVMDVLEFGERVDGSSLFSFIDPNKSDIYITPKMHTAFVNPFSTSSAMNILCKYLDENGNPLDIAPETILARAEEKLRTSSYVTLKALAELEFYIISEQEPTELLFPSTAEKHYHESAPFSRFEAIRHEILTTLASIGITTKYAHGEVGRMATKDSAVMEQHEIEPMPQNLTRMAETIAVTKWVIRNTCAKYNVSASFSPKIAIDHAGNGLHIHLCGLKDGRSIIADFDGSLSVESKKMIGGILKLASSLTAFGNAIPISYIRFVSRKESPIHICWGARNRLALIRIPLWWSFKQAEGEADECRKTFEFRAPDPSANTHFLLAAISVAVRYGLENAEESLRIAEELHFERKHGKRLKSLPKSCNESASHLKKERKYYEAEGIFPKVLIESTIKKLKAYKDKDLAKKLKEEPRKIEELIQRYLHYG